MTSVEPIAATCLSAEEHQDHLSFLEAKKLYTCEYAKGRRGNTDAIKFPFSLNAIDDVFVVKLIPIVDIKILRVRQEYVEKYSAILKNSEMSPAWLSFGKTLVNGDINANTNTVFIARDGNHRLTASCFLKRKTYPCYVLKNQYLKYMELKHAQNS